MQVIYKNFMFCILESKQDLTYYLSCILPANPAALGRQVCQNHGRPILPGVPPPSAAALPATWAFSDHQEVAGDGPGRPPSGWR